MGKTSRSTARYGTARHEADGWRVEGGGWRVVDARASPGKAQKNAARLYIVSVGSVDATENGYTKISCWVDPRKASSFVSLSLSLSLSLSRSVSFSLCLISAQLSAWPDRGMRWPLSFDSRATRTGFPRVLHTFGVSLFPRTVSGVSGQTKHVFAWRS